MTIPGFECLNHLYPPAEEAEVEEDYTPYEEECPELTDPGPATNRFEAASGGIPLMITQKMKAELRARGYTNEEIRQLTPERAREILAKPDSKAADRPELKPDRDEAERFLAALDPSTDRFTFQTFDDNKERKDKSLARVLHGTLAQHFKTLVKLNERGAGIFVCVNVTDFKGRT